MEAEAVEGRVELRLLEGLRQVVGSTELHRLHNRIRLAHDRDHQDRQLGPRLPDAGEGRKAVGAGHHHVEQDEVRVGAVLEEREGP